MIEASPSPSDETTIVGNLDMSDERDRGMLRTALGGPKRRRPRWPMSYEEKTDYTKALRVAMRMALEKQDHRSIRGIVATAVLIEGQNQADEHFEAKNARIDAGLATESVQVTDRREAVRRLMDNPAAYAKFLEAEALLNPPDDEP